MTYIAKKKKKNKITKIDLGDYYLINGRKFNKTKWDRETMMCEITNNLLWFLKNDPELYNNKTTSQKQMKNSNEPSTDEIFKKLFGCKSQH